MIYTCTLNPALDYRLVLSHLEEGKLNRSVASMMMAGGKGINVSIVLNHLHCENIATGFLGGFTGKYLKDHLEKDLKLNTDFIEVDDMTRINVKLKHDELETEINQEGPFITPKDAEKLFDYVHHLEPSDILVCSGLQTRGVDDIYNHMAKICHQKGMELIIDTVGADLMESLMYQPLLIKPNIHELEELFKTKIHSEIEIIHYGKELVKRGAKNVIISRGSEGSVLIRSDKIYKSDPLPKKVMNTVGAGDSMIAGFVSEYAKTKDVYESYKLAVACAEATVSSACLASYEEIEKMKFKVNIYEVTQRESEGLH